MYKKISSALLISFLAASLVGGWASALAAVSVASSPKTTSDLDPNHRAVLGQVVGIETDYFTAQSQNGELHTIDVTDETIFRSRAEGEGQPASYEDLEVGMWVAVGSRKDQNEDFAARLVIILPDDFEPPNIQGRRVIGEVDKINSGQNTFDLTTRQGENLTFSVNDSTRFAGTMTELKDLEKGMLVGMLAVEQEDGTLLAKMVVNEKLARTDFDRKGGRISEVGENSLTIITRQDEALTFNITENTRFGSRDGSISSLDDLAVEDVVVVVFKPSDAETPDAVAVMYADGTLLSLARVTGEVQSAGGSHLTLTSFEGEKLTFTVDENTRIRGQEVEDLNDIKNGMKSLVLYIVEEDGTLLAKGILVGSGDRQPNK